MKLYRFVICITVGHMATTSPSEFTGNYGTQTELLKIVIDWLDYEDKKTGQIEASNPYTRNNLFYE